MTYPGSNEAPTDQPAGPQDSPEILNAGQQPGPSGPTVPPPAGSAPPEPGADGAIQQGEQKPETSTTNVAINIPGQTTSSGPTTIAGVLYQINNADESHKVEEEKSLHDS